jgi:hypothetical protein
MVNISSDPRIPIAMTALGTPASIAMAILPHDLILSHWRCLDLLLDLVRVFYFGFSAAGCVDSDGGMTTSDKG